MDSQETAETVDSQEMADSLGTADFPDFLELRTVLTKIGLSTAMAMISLIMEQVFMLIQCNAIRSTNTGCLDVLGNANVASRADEIYEKQIS